MRAGTAFFHGFTVFPDDFSSFPQCCSHFILRITRRAITLCEAASVSRTFQQLTSPSRRLSSRFEAASQNVWVYWNCDGRDDVSRVRDISMGGLFIETGKSKELGVATNLHFLVQEGQIRADAVVRHTVTGGGLGLKFIAVSEEDRRNLSALMTRLRSSL